MVASGCITSTKHAAQEKSDWAAPGARIDPNQMMKSPTERPPFTLSQIKKAILPHCFYRSVVRSFSYVAHDLLISSVLLYIALTWIPTIPAPFHYAAWALYWAVQGCVLGGIWILGHECGHHAFSDYAFLDDFVGLVLHSVLLVPYFSFKYSHRRHHSNTGSLEHDEVFVPKQKCDIPWYYKYIYDNPVGRFLSLTIQLMLGWTLYLAFNVSGRTYPCFACHYDPYSPIYSDRERAYIFISDGCVVAVVFALYCLASSFGLWWLVRVYGVPLLVGNGCIVCLSYLQHTHPALPHYDSTEWDWLRGALSTVDRDYWLLNHVFHNATDTHVVHHLLPSIPHYHAMEATEAIKPILGEYYRFDGTPVFQAIWREAKECIYVEQEDGGTSHKSRGVFWYNSKF